MAKFKVGDKVRVKSNLTYDDGHPRSLSCWRNDRTKR